MHNYFKKVTKTMKNEQTEYLLIVLFILFVVIDVDVPHSIATVVDTLLGRIVLIGLGVALCLHHPVLGVVSLIVIYELIHRSERSIGTYQDRLFIPSEKKKTEDIQTMNVKTFEGTLEEEMVKKVNQGSTSFYGTATYKPIQEKLYDAKQL